MAGQGQPLALGDAGRRSAFSPVLRPAGLAGPASPALSYEPGIADSGLVEEGEEEDDIIEIASTFPLGQCSRTSPANHATIRRWRQRSSRWAGKQPRTHSAAGYSRPMEVLVTGGCGDAGPLSAPSSCTWNRTTFSPLAASPFPPPSPVDRVFSPLPAAASTPLVPQPKFPFNISSIVAPGPGETPRRGEKAGRGRAGREQIPVGIAVARQRHTEMAKVALASQRQPEMAATEAKPESGRPEGPGYPAAGYPAYPYHLPWGYPHPYLLPPDYLYLQQQLMLLHQAQKDYLHPGHYPTGPYPPPLAPLAVPHPWQEGPPPVARDPKESPHAFSLSLPTDDSGLEMSTESNNNLTKETSGGGEGEEPADTTPSPAVPAMEVLREGPSPDAPLEVDHGAQQVREDQVSVGSESEYGLSPEPVAGVEPVIKDKEEEGDIGEGLKLLTEGIECMEELGQMKSAVDCLGEMKLKSMRHLSVDSYHHKKYDSLQLLCDVASSVQKGEVGPRGVRSKSLDVESQKRLAELADVNRNHRSPRAEKDVKAFISRKTNSYQMDRSSSQEAETKVGGVGGRPSVLSSWSSDPGDMEAWELDIRIRMAEKQRRYTEITRKLKRLQSLKSKKLGGDSPRKGESPKKRETPKKSESQRKLETPRKTELSRNKPDPRKEAKSEKTPTEQSVKPEEAAVAPAEQDPTDLAVPEKVAVNVSEEICSPEKPLLDKASSFTDAFHKFKKAYNAKKSTSDAEAKPSSVMPNTSPAATPKPSNFTPFSNWARIAAETSPSPTVTVKVEPCLEPLVTIKIEPVEEEAPAPCYLQCPIKKEPGVESLPVRKRNSEESIGKLRASESAHVRKKPKLEKFVVSDVIKSPRKKSTEQEDSWKERKKFRKDRRHSQELGSEKKTWKVVSTFDRNDESASTDKNHHKKLDVVLTQSHIKKGITPGDHQKTKLGKSDKKIKLEENRSDKEESPIKDGKAEILSERATSTKPHKHKKEKKHKKDHHRDVENPEDRVERRRRKKEKRIKKEGQIKVQHETEGVEVKQEPSGDLGQSCILTGPDLKDGLRILRRAGPHFYPGRVTDISPPDIYGILVDGERGNKPHIASREEVLQEAVLDVRPASVAELPVGARVCAYWSSKISYLHPGTVAAPDIDSNYVIVELDDGDSRDIHIKDVRYLPPDYPIVEREDDQIAAILGGRRRSTPSAGTTPVKQKKGSKLSGSPKVKTEEWSVSVTELPSSSLAIPCKAVPCLPDLSQLPGVKLEAERDDDQDSAFVSNGAGGDCDSDFDDVEKPHQRRTSGSDKSKIAAFLPPRHLLWAWADVGKKLSPKARKLFHQRISKEEETINVGDCAVFLSTGRPDRPYIGRIQSMWESWAGHMKVQVKWFYHAAETEGTAQGGGRVEDIQTPGALFESSHYDENDVQTISHKCEVVKYSEVLARSGGEGEEETVYYLAGQYDPVVGSIVFATNLFK